MDSYDKLNEIYNVNGTCYYFDYIIKIRDFDFVNISLDEKSYKTYLLKYFTYMLK